MYNSYKTQKLQTGNYFYYLAKVKKKKKYTKKKTKKKKAKNIYKLNNWLCEK